MDEHDHINRVLQDELMQRQIQVRARNAMILAVIYLAIAGILVALFHTS